MLVGFLYNHLCGKGQDISSQWKCEAKPVDEHSIAVGDQEGHAYHIGQGKCPSEKGAMGDVKEQEGTYTEFGDVAGNTVANHGVFIVTLATSDRFSTTITAPRP